MFVLVIIGRGDSLTSLIAGSIYSEPKHNRFVSASGMTFEEGTPALAFCDAQAMATIFMGGAQRDPAGAGAPHGFKLVENVENAHAASLM